MFYIDDYARIALDNVVGLGIDENENQPGDYALCIEAYGLKDKVHIPIETYSGDMVRTIMEASNDKSGIAEAIGIPTFDSVFGMRRLKNGSLMLFNRDYYLGAKDDSGN